ncbi:MAG: PAS domain S-box protein [Ferruginibacter sp.]
MQGLVSFNPNQVSLNFSSTPILVDNVRLDSMDIFPTGAFDIGNNINNITFSISNSFWGDRPNDVLQYRIIGSKDANTEGQWLFVDASGKVNLFSPSYGKYELQIRKRKGLQPGDYVYKTINFTVLPKWYQTTLFFICRAILFGLLLTGIFFWRRSYYRRSNRILKEKVNAATSQLQQINSTLEKKVEERTEAIQEAEKKFRTLVEGSLAGVYIVQDELYTYVNPRFEEILGYGKGELIGVNSVSVIKEDQQSMVREKVRRRMAGEIESEHYETIILKKDGEERHVEFFGSRTIYEGKPTIIGTMLDITERKITEDQLIQEKDLSNSIINNLPGIFYIFNKEGKHLLWNKNFETVTGYTAAELGEKLAGSMTDEEGIVLLRNGIGRAYTEGYGEAEAALVAKDGTKYYYYYNGITINYNNEPCILGVGIDITERQRAREQLTKEKDLSQSIINNLPGVFYIFDQQGNYLLWNKNHEIVTGYTAAEMSKMHPTKFIEQSYLKSLGERMEKVFKEGYAELEAPFITKDGRMIPYYFNGILINYNDKPCINGCWY